MAFAAIGCGPKDGRDDIVEVGPLSKVPFAVTDFFTPSGQMGDGALPDHITMNAGKHCKARPDGARGRCYNFLYEAGSNHWAGVYWAYPSNNWGSETGRRFKPWRFDAATGQLYQRYNKANFQAAAERDTVQIRLAGTDSTGKTYTLRNATLNLDGPAPATIDGETYEGHPATLATSVNDPKAILVVKPGAYTVTLQAGWTLVTPDAMGMNAAVDATLVTNPVSFSVAPGVDAATTLDFTVPTAAGGTDTVHLEVGNPKIAVNFFAGGINDPTLVGITCKDPNQVCDHRDQVSTAKPIYQLSRTWQQFSMGLLMAPPCVNTTDPTSAGQSKFADKTGVVKCATNTLTADGSVATCPPGRPGLLNADNTITCCDTPFVSGVCQGTATAGSWQKAEEIEQTVIGGFGWATNYAEFEAQAAILAGAAPPAPSGAGGASGTIASVGDISLPPTTVYLDDIVWDFVAQ